MERRKKLLMVPKLAVRDGIDQYREGSTNGEYHYIVLVGRKLTTLQAKKRKFFRKSVQVVIAQTYDPVMSCRFT